MVPSGRVALSRMTAVSYGTAAADAVAREVVELGADRVFLLTSRTLDRETDEISKLRDALGARVVGQFSDMPPHTPRAKVIEAAAAARSADSQLIVTFGGGSVTDAAKAVRLCLANEIVSAADMDVLRTRHDGNGHVLPPDFAAPRVPQISIPTTLSAGEFSAIAGVTDERHDTKEIFSHPDIIPQIAVLDPMPSRHTPEWLFLSTGIRAVDHCVEGICSHEANAYGDAQALKGLSLLVAGLMGVKADPGDMGARLDAQMGAWMSMGPLASGVPMGASHGIGYVLGAAFGVPHGYTSCAMLPAVMRWNAPANAARQALVADAIGEVPGAASEAAADKLIALISNLGMPANLRAIEIAEADFPMIAEGAMNTPWVPRNPRTIAGSGDIIEILKIAM